MPAVQEHLIFSEHMKPAPFDERIKEAFLGQAHIAGTGPTGKTCRECKYWHKWGYDKISGQKIAAKPMRHGKKHKELPGEPKKAMCNRPISNKAHRLIPHFAKSCRLFEQADKPMPVKVEK